ncbi:hypothetical protein [Streptomyces sp. cmx-18-6]|uniref:hypothetical protein n=1 Tax=Streptomyces sp. cmx-18-6 TaxID=2790930 RepID=UPI00397FBC7F
MSREVERKQGDGGRGGIFAWSGKVPARMAIGYGAAAGTCTVGVLTLSLWVAGGMSLGLVLFWVLLMGVGPGLAGLLFSMPVEKRRAGRAIGMGLASVAGQLLWAAPFTVLIGLVVSKSAYGVPLLVWLLNSGYSAFWASYVSGEPHTRAAARRGRPAARPTGAAAPAPASEPARRDGLPAASRPARSPRSAEEEEAITEFGELLQAHPFDATLPGVDYVQRADYSQALNAYNRAKAAHRGDVLDVLAEGRTALGRLDARMGLDTVQSGAGCFFDPRHGPAVTSVEYTPSGGASRRVEVCRADAVRLADERGGRGGRGGQRRGGGNIRRASGW